VPFSPFFMGEQYVKKRGSRYCNVLTRSIQLGQLILSGIPAPLIYRLFLTLNTELDFLNRSVSNSMGVLQKPNERTEREHTRKMPANTCTPWQDRVVCLIFVQSQQNTRSAMLWTQRVLNSGYGPNSHAYSPLPHIPKQNLQATYGNQAVLHAINSPPTKAGHDPNTSHPERDATNANAACEWFVRSQGGMR